MRKKLSAIPGFTLIELLVVISILGLLAALIMANFNVARERARDVQRKSDLDQIKKSLRMYYNNDGLYPADDGSNNIVGCGTVAAPAFCTWDGDNSWTQSGMIYMKTLPQDPNFDSTDATSPRYRYLMDDSGSQDFCLWAALENHSDADIGQSQSRCSTACSGASLDAAEDYAVCAD